MMKHWNSFETVTFQYLIRHQRRLLLTTDCDELHVKITELLILDVCD